MIKKYTLYLFGDYRMKKRLFLLCVLHVLLFSSICEGNDNIFIHKEIYDNNHIKEHNDSVKNSRNNIYQDLLVDVEKCSTLYDKNNEEILIKKTSDNGKTTSKELLLKKIIRKKGTITRWHYADYDGDGKKEAFAVVGSTPISGIYFIDDRCKVTLMKRGGAYTLGRLARFSEGKYFCSIGGKKYFFVDHNNNYSTWWNKTLIFGVKKGVPYELNISDKLSGFYIRKNNYFTIKHYLEGHHVYMKIQLIYNKKTQQFTFGKKIGEDSSLQLHNVFGSV